MTRTPDGPGSVVVPGVVSPQSLVTVRSLGSRGINTVVATEDPSVPVTASRYCDETVQVPSAYEDVLGYKEALLSLAARPDVRAIVPNREADAFVLSRYRDEFAEHVAPLWAPFETLSTVHDGLRLAELAEDLGVPVPETRLFDDVDDWDEELIIKSRYSILTWEYDDALDVGESHSRLGQVHPTPGVVPDRQSILAKMRGHVPVVQEYVPIRYEYSFRAIYDHGEAKATTVRRQIRGQSYAGGISVYREIVDNPEIEALGLALLDALDWHGLASVQFIESAETGEYLFNEINPRTWASLACDVRAGADYPSFYWLLANGQGDRIDPSHEVGFGCHVLHGEVKYLRSVLFDDYPNAERPSFPASLGAVLASIVEQPHFDYLRPDDPMPFLRGLTRPLVGDRRWPSTLVGGVPGRPRWWGTSAGTGASNESESVEEGPGEVGRPTLGRPGRDRRTEDGRVDGVRVDGSIDRSGERTE